VKGKQTLKNKSKAQQIIENLGLEPHPEGGYFIETYRSTESLSTECLPERYLSERSISSAIYYLLTPDSASMMHRLDTDEVFHFYSGAPVLLFRMFADGAVDTIVMGNNILEGQIPQCLVPKGCWQGLMLAEGGDYALMGATVAPAFSFDGFEIGERDILLREYPACKEAITKLTRST